MNMFAWTIVILTVGLIGLLTALALTAITMLP